MRELTLEEVGQVNGGNPLLVIATAIGVADMFYDAYKGFSAGFASTAN